MQTNRSCYPESSSLHRSTALHSCQSRPYTADWCRPHHISASESEPLASSFPAALPASRTSAGMQKPLRPALPVSSPSSVSRRCQRTGTALQTFAGCRSAGKCPHASHPQNSQDLADFLQRECGGCIAVLSSSPQNMPADRHGGRCPARRGYFAE